MILPVDGTALNFLGVSDYGLCHPRHELFFFSFSVVMVYHIQLEIEP